MVVLAAWGSGGWKGKQVANGAESGFEAPGYDDSSWATVTLPLGGAGGCPIDSQYPANTTWNVNTDFLLRRTIGVGSQIAVNFAIDNNATFYMGGSQFHALASGGCATRGPVTAAVTSTTTLAIRCHDYGTTAYFDCEVFQPQSIILTNWHVGQIGYG